MILKALCKLAEREELVLDPDFEIRPVSWVVRIGDGGTLLGIEPIKQSEQLPPDSKKKPKLLGWPMYVPYQGGRTGNDKAYFLVDKSEYALGIDPAGERDLEKLKIRFKLFVDQVEQCWISTKAPQIRAVYIFLKSLLDGESSISLPDGCLSNDLFAFAYSLDECRIHEYAGIKNYWKDLRKDRNSKEVFTQICLVEGMPLPVAGKIPLLEKLPGGGSSGVALVSYNKPAFESYGWREKSGCPVANAAVSEKAANASMTALNRLLHPNPPDPHDPNQTLSKQNIQLSSDTVVCYWTKELSELSDSFGLAIEVDSEKVEAKPEQIREMYKSLWRGVPYKLAKPDQFYSLVLSGGQGRATVRDWVETSTQYVVDSLAQYFEDLRIEHRGQIHSENFPLLTLLEALADPKERRKEGIPSAIGTQFYRASIDRKILFPQSAYQRAILRYRVEQGNESDKDSFKSWNSKKWNDARAAIIKAYLNRKWRKETKHEEVKETMNPYCTDKGYLLGQLMAVLEKLQQKAMGEGVNATIVDRYFAGASTSPKSVFGSLLRNARHHVSKVKDDPKKRGSVKIYESLIDQLCSQFEISVQDTTDSKSLYKNGFPPTLSQDEQGMFVLGYHQMRKWLKWKPKEEHDAWNADHADAPSAYLWERKDDNNVNTETEGELK